MLQIFFEVDSARAFNPENFLWNASDLSFELKSHVKDAGAFSVKFNSLLNMIPSKEVVTVEVHQPHTSSEAISNVQDSPTQYDFDISGGEVPVLQSVSNIYHRWVHV